MKKLIVLAALVIVFSAVNVNANHHITKTVSYYTDEYGNRIKQTCRKEGTYNHGCRGEVIRKAPKPRKNTIKLRGSGYNPDRAKATSEFYRRMAED